MSTDFAHADIRTYGRFGRFGRVHDDGLSTVAVTPRGFDSLPGAVEFHVRWGDPTAPLAAVVPEIDPTEKRLAIDGGGDGAPTLVRYTLLYPGLSAWFGKRMVLHFVDASGQPMRTAIDPSRYRAGDGILIIPGDRFPATPIWIAPSDPDGLKVWHDGANLSFESAGDIGEVRFATPVGIGRVRSVREAWNKALALRDLPVPARRSARHRLVDGGARVETVETFSSACAPIPPVLAVALDNGYPVEIDGPLVRTSVVTPCGPWAYVAQDRLTVRLPVPNPVRRGLIPARDGRATARLRTAVAKLAKSGRITGAGAELPMGCTPVLEDPLRTVCVLAHEERVRGDWDGRANPWIPDLEPITGHAYVRAATEPDAQGRRFGVADPIAVALERLESVLAHRAERDAIVGWWPRVVRTGRFPDLSEDWAWMMPCTGDHGSGSGGARGTTLAFASALASLRLTERLGSSDDLVRASVRVSRTAVGALARLWWTPAARRMGWIPRGAWISGWKEKEGWSVVRPVDPGWSDFLGGQTGPADWLRLVGTFAIEPARQCLKEATALRGGARNSLPPRYSASELLARRILGLDERDISDRRIAALGISSGAGTAFWHCLAEASASEAPAAVIAWADLGYESGWHDPGEGVAELRFRSATSGRRKVELLLSNGWSLRDVRIADKSIPWSTNRGRCAWTGWFPVGTTTVRIRYDRSGAHRKPVLSPIPIPTEGAPSGLGLAPP